jgi:eukaryotic-like serine/threonine-protein kinase
LQSDLRNQLQATLGDAYTLDRELGGGGMSRVFVAEERRLGRRVVIKVLPAEMAAGMSAERFEREIRVAAGLQHAHIVPLLSAGESDGLPYYTMPYVDGESLRARLARGPLAIGEAFGVLRDVAKALSYAHAHGVVHRDIKPDNVLISGGSAVVADFGIAKAVSAARGEGRLATPTLTSVGTSLGTPAYMAPEQAAADITANHRVDIYSFGCLAYELLTGKPPFVEKSTQKLLAAHFSETPQDVRELRPDTPAALAELVMRCLAKDADARPQTGDEIVRVLDVTTSGDVQPPMPGLVIGGMGRIWRGLAVYAAAFIGVAIVARASIVAIGLPEWVFTGAIVVMALGLPVLLATAFVHWATHRAMTVTPALTPGGSPAGQGTIATMAIKASPHLNWRRATMGGWLAIGGFVLLVVGYMATRAMGIGPAASLLASGRISERDVIVVTDFTIRGADSTLGTVLAEAVRTDLAQSAVVSILPTSAVAATLRRMERPADTPIDLALAREIAIREGAKAIVDGEITPLGGAYVVALRLVPADNSPILASFHATAPSATELLATLGGLSKSLRGKLGESLKRVQASPPLEQVTTSSLPALRKQVEAGRAINIEGDYEKAIRLAREAIALDSTFAMAHRAIAIAARNSALSPTVFDSAIGKAYQYRDRLTERERLLTTAEYFLGPRRDRVRAISAYEELLSVRPDDRVALTNLGGLVAGRREFARAESLYRRAIAVDSTALTAYSNLPLVLVSQAKLQDASRVIEEAIAKPGGNQRFLLSRGLVLYASGEIDSLRQLMGTAASGSNRFLQSEAVGVQAGLAQRGGQLRLAERLQRQRSSLDAARGAPSRIHQVEVDAAMRDIWFGDRPERAVARLDSVLRAAPLTALPAEERPYFRLAGAYALAGRPDRARAVIAQYEREVRDTTLRRFNLPDRQMAEGVIAFAEKRPREAIEEFRRSDRRPDGPADWCSICTFVPIAMAFDMAEMPDSAIVHYRRYIDTPHVFRIPDDAWYLASTHKRLGELYEAKGDVQQAIHHTAKFIDLWKDADPELQPKVAEAKRRLERLRRASGG